MKKPNLLIALVLIFVFLTGCNKTNECVPKNPADFNHNGCGNFFVYDKLKNDTSSWISVFVDRDNIDLEENEKIFDIQSTPEIDVKIEKFNSGSGNNYCTDAIIPGLEVTNTWNGTSGQIKARIIRDKCEDDESYVVSVELENAILLDANNDTIKIDNIRFDSVYVNQIMFY